MNKFFKIFAIFLFLCSCENKNTSPLAIETDNGALQYNVEVASTIEELQTGLMNRESLPADSGMLFDLSVVNGQNTAMWMKNTKIALDMLFITPEGLIFWIKENAQPYSEDLIISPFPAAAVLELNAGEVAKKGIRIGNVVKHPIFPMKKVEVSLPVVENINNDSVTEESVFSDNIQSTENAAPEENVASEKNNDPEENVAPATEDSAKAENMSNAANAPSSEASYETTEDESSTTVDTPKAVETK